MITAKEKRLRQQVTDLLKSKNLYEETDLVLLDELLYQFHLINEAKKAIKKPFASYNSPYGIAVTDVERTDVTTSVSLSLSVIPRVAFEDIVVCKIITSPSWTNKITSIAIPSMDV